LERLVWLPPHLLSSPPRGEDMAEQACPYGSLTPSPLSSPPWGEEMHEAPPRAEERREHD